MSSSWHNQYVSDRKLGSGGNARVILVREKNTNKKYALKELHKNKKRNKETRERFKAEIQIAKKYSKSIDGIIPIIESNCTEYWYTMPIATSVLEYIRDKSIVDIVNGTIQILETLSKLHKEGVSHRDIKPSNIYYYNNRFSLGDFGLIDFPDNFNDFTRSDRGLGAIFTIAPEMKRNPKNADGKKADVYSLAKTLWMFLSGDERGFDGEYNYLDPSHSLRYLDKYKDTHLVEIDELLKDATNNEPTLRPTMREFKERLEKWIDVYSDDNKSQASEWNFLKKQLLGPKPADSAVWRTASEIVDVLNIIGRTSVYNHMLFSDIGGLDFTYAEIASEEGCIKVYDSSKQCYVVKPKSLHYEGFGENFRWNYFLLELGNLNPVLEVSKIADYERLVEDTPGNYVSSSYFQYGVYDYDTGEPLPEGHEVVNRYLKGKFLIVMKGGPYNKISGTYDGRHGMVSNTVFRTYIEKLISLYNEGFQIVKQNEDFNDLSNNELERKILNTNFFNENPFELEEVSNYSPEEMKKLVKKRQESREFVQNNFNKWNFSSVLDSVDENNSKILFYFEFRLPNMTYTVSFDKKVVFCICKDGYIKEIDPHLDSQCYYITDRSEAILLRQEIQETINNFLNEEGFQELDKYENYISIRFIKNGNPTHLFTKDEVKRKMKNADDRVHNQLIVDEEGNVRVIEDEQIRYGHLFPVRLEIWNAGHIYVGKYSKLNTVDDNYHALLEEWLNYLISGEAQYRDYPTYHSENFLLEEIKKYY